MPLVNSVISLGNASRLLVSCNISFTDILSSDLSLLLLLLLESVSPNKIEVATFVISLVGAG